jgi:tetratricopeptide (TPR) repeat protein
MTLAFSACKRKNGYATSKLAWHYLAKGAHNEALGNKKEAVKDYDTLIKLEPFNAEGYYCKAILDTSLKDYDGSIRDINKAITVLPKAEQMRLEVYLSFRGDAKRVMGKTTEAISDYKTVIRICDQALIKYSGDDFARDEKRENEIKLKNCYKMQ